MGHLSEPGLSMDGPTDFTVDVSEVSEGVGGISVTGAVDLQTAPRLSEAVRGAQEHSRGVIVDLQRVDFLSSAGLSVLVEAAQRADDTGGRLAIIATNHTVLRALEVTGLDSVLALFDSEADALDHVQRLGAAGG